MGNIVQHLLKRKKEEEKKKKKRETKNFGIYGAMSGIQSIAVPARPMKSPPLKGKKKKGKEKREG